MNQKLEEDFAHQQMALDALLVHRKTLQDDSEEARQCDREIMKTRNLILSYETLKYYELRVISKA